MGILKTSNFILGGVLLFTSCKSVEKPDFKEWYSNRTSKHVGSAPTVRQTLFFSSALKIDTIYRSMQGPYEVKEVELESDGDELLWLTAYESWIERVGGDAELLPDKYMCHNNFNHADAADIPWKVKTNGINPRIFTLTEGQTKVTLPKGFGIPVPAEQAFQMVSQVLNHQEKNLDISTRHHVSLKYIKDSELDSPLQPLYQQAIFVTKQISGPAGAYGLPQLCIENSLDKVGQNSMPKHDCSVELKDEDFNPYQDSKGRKYTGHWVLPYGREELTTDVTSMMDLEKNTRIHFIGAHLHPFAQGLELWDKSADSLLYEVEIESKAEGFGFQNISYFQSEEGIEVFKDHRYELKSIYNCPDSTEEHTAMAVMYLYLAE